MPKPNSKQPEINVELLAASIVPESLDAERRSVDVVFFTANDVDRVDYFTGEPYILRFNADGADLSLLNNGAPVFDNHDTFGGAASQKGVVDKAWRKGNEFLATLRFSRRPDVEGLWQDIQDKIVNKYSMGVMLLEKRELPREKGKTRVVEVLKWRPREISTAPLPADNNTRTLSAEADNRATGPQEQQMEPNTITDAGTQARPNEAELAVQREAILAADRTRTAELTSINALFVKRGVAAEKLNLGAAIKDGITADQFRARAIDALAELSEQNPTQTHHVELTRDERDTRLACAEAAVLHLSAPSRFTVDGQNEFRGMSVSRLAEELLNRSGKSTRGKSKSEIAELSMHATADFPLILADSQRKVMLSAYSATPTTYKMWTKASTSPDFKTMSRLRLGEAPAPLLVKEGAQIQLGTMTESREQYALLTYGRGLSFTRQMLINDDLSAFTNLVEAFGMQTARFENKTVYSVLTANATMSDSVALFHATHANLGSGAIGDTALDAANLAMATQTGLDATTVLNISPEFLIVPKAKEVTALRAMMAVGENVKASDRNMFAGRFKVIADAELDSNSAAVWYMAANPTITPGVEYAYLEGATGPQMIRQENAGAILGVQLYFYIDFGAKAVDWRPLYKSTGV